MFDHRRFDRSRAITLAFYILILIALAIAAMFRPAYALGLALCNYGIQQWTLSQDPFFLQYMSLTNYVTTLMLLYAILLKMAKGHRVLGNYPRVGWWTLGLLAMAAVSFFWSVYPEGAIENWTGSWRTLLVFLLLSPLLVGDEQDMRAGLMGTLAVGSLILLLLITNSQWMGRSVVWSSNDTRSLRAAGGNPLAIASMAAHVVILALLLNFQGIGRYWQVLRWGLLILGAFICVKSARGQSLALLLVLLAFLPISRRIRNLAGFVTTSIGLLLVAGVAYWAYKNIADPTYWQTDLMIRAYGEARIELVRLLLGFWAKGSPLTWLVGLGSSASYDPRIIGGYPHLVLLEALGELGIVGMGILLYIWFQGFACARRLYQIVRDDTRQRGTLAAISAMACFEIILSFKQGSLIGSPMMFGTLIMLGRWDIQARQHQAALEPLPLEPVASWDQDWTPSPAGGSVDNA